jgi:hypothetical protein
MGQENSGRGPTYRAALAAVIILSALFIAGVVALIIGFMRQYEIYQSARHKAAAATDAAAKGAAPAVIELEPGAHIVSAQTAQGRLVLQLATPKGSEVEVLDLSSGKLLFRVAPHP